MNDPPSALRSFLIELKRRRVYRVAAVYAAVAFVIWQAADFVLPAARLPDWAPTLVLILTVIGFPIALALAWAFDITAEGVKRTGSTVAVSAAGVSADGGKRLVVLPFENLGPPEDGYFADGITEEITSRLGELGGLGVIGRTSAIQYKKTDKRISEIGAELAVEYVLEGTVRWEKATAGESRVRVTPQLIRVSDETHLWTKRYDAVLSGIFGIQSDIAEQVAGALEVSLLGSERRALEARPTENLEAYDYYLRGIDYFRRGMLERDLRLALQMFEKAVELDAGFALAHARISFVHTLTWHLTFDYTEERLGQAKVAVDEALELDPQLGEAHLSLAVYHISQFRHERAEEELRIARKSQANNSEFWRMLGAVKWWRGQFREALEDMHEAHRVDPRYAVHLFNIGMIHRQLREYAEAERYYERAIALSPDDAVSQSDLASLYLAWKGDTGTARERLAIAVRAGAGSGWLTPLVRVQVELFDRDYQAALDQLSAWEHDALNTLLCFIPRDQLRGQICGLLGDGQRERSAYESARVAVESALERSAQDARLHSALGIAYAGLGLKEDALQEGEKALELDPLDKDACVGPNRIADLAQILTMVGERNAAIKQLEHLLLVPGYHSAQLLSIDPTWDPLREHPRFQKLLDEHR
ncbi:MAG: tetratricopeptide repeat protein [Gemmatimonadota bacterium]|nr:MAG: tetratricopeptide repeat protein [Gemmatimonadota bacterium]